MKPLTLLVLGAALLPAQPPAPLVSPEVAADRRVTFRFRAPNAQAVLLELEGRPKPLEMTKGENGVWTLTTDPLTPQIYGYRFRADGNSVLDPANSQIKPSILFIQSSVSVPGEPGMPWEHANVPRGTLHQHFLDSKLIGDRRDFWVYTPPGFTPKKKYPLLVLLHGFGDHSATWSTFGRANVILDNLLAQGKVKPMIVVMPLGYGAPEIVQAARGPRDPNVWSKNVTMFRESLMKEVLPAASALYPFSAKRDERAIAGLSMGGSEALYTGLNELASFAWIGSFSAGGMLDADKTLSALKPADNARIKLLWIACGTEDGLIAANRKFVAWLKEKNLRHEYVETTGAHTWMIWREYLSAFAPKLFQ